MAEDGTTTTLTYAGAVNAALARALEEFPESILFGEDVAAPGGIFGCSRGLRERFGARVFDTPISEAAILGAGLGAAMMGRRPVVEIMWADFVLVALDQLVNQAANTRYVSRGALHAPLTVRMQQGALPGSCAQHSQSLEAVFAHIPGLRVAMPATAQDAYALLLAAIACDDPAIVIEHRAMYQSVSGAVRVGASIEAVGGGRIVREGSDVTVVAWGPMVAEAEAAAQELGGSGVALEVVDPRWIAPLDFDLICASVQKTRRLVIAHHANVTGGFGAEVAARVARDAFWSLEAPIERIGLPDLRVPAAPSLQRAIFPTKDDIVSAALRAVAV